MDFDEIVHWLKEEDEDKLRQLWNKADEIRKRYVGDEVHLRGLIEISNFCTKDCLYCGIRRSNYELVRYRMSEGEIIECACLAQRLGYGTVVLQSGEDRGLTAGFVSGLIKRIKEETGLAITLSLGEQSKQTLEMWKSAGADRYLLKFETSDQELFNRIHPKKYGKSLSRRLKQLEWMRELGYEVGSGIMVGIPYQTYESIARDIMLFRDLDLDMVGIGPYVPHPQTPLGKDFEEYFSEHQRYYVPNNDLMTYKVIALTRILCPTANIPATTALATIRGKEGRRLALQRGANVIMPNLTPVRYKRLYEIYPGKVAIDKDFMVVHEEIIKIIHESGRVPGIGVGGRKRT